MQVTEEVGILLIFNTQSMHNQVTQEQKRAPE